VTLRLSSAAALRDLATVYTKELRDALRDRRTLLTVLASSVLLGPLVLLALSGFVATLEARAEQRELYAVGIDHAPTLRNFLERQTIVVRAAPPDYAAKLRSAALGAPVLLVRADFEAALDRGEAPPLTVVSDSSDTQSQAGAGRVAQWLAAFARERTVLTLALQGVAVDVLEPVRIEEQDLANAAGRSTQATGMLPFFVLMAVMAGALNAALDTTAGERERGSLEPLLMNPSTRSALVVGKWTAVTTVGVLVAVLACFSFLPGQWLLRSDTLAALFRYGPREAALFVLVLVPFASAVSALLMAVAIGCRSFKEAQARTAVVTLAASLLPLVSVLRLGGDSAADPWLPALAQNVLMTHVLKGDDVGLAAMAIPFAVCTVLTVASLAYVVRALAPAAVR
jgi:sodium transport system permease protein